MRKLLYLVLLLPFLGLSQVAESFLLNLTEITVKQGHTAQFIEGVKSWKECYMDNKGENKWQVWSRVQGEGSVFVMTSRMAKWAEMDEEGGDEAGKECRMIVVNLIMPHVKSIHYNIASSMPELSRASLLPEDTGLVNVFNFKTSNSNDFREVVSALSSTMKKTEQGNRAIWYSVMGGAPEVADYFVSVPFKNFADLDNDRDGVWTVYEKAHGKEKTNALRAKFRASISSDWSYMYSLNKALSNQ